MSQRPAHFTASDEGYLPSAYAQSHWSEGQLNGPAIVGLVARELEHRFGSEDFLPARLTVDLFKAARTTPTTVVARMLRDGRRIRNVECDVVQNDVVVAHAVLAFYRRSAPPPGQLWTRDPDFTFPPSLDPGEVSVRPHTGSDAVGWTRTVSEHQNNSRTRFVDQGIDVVSGQRNSPFVRAAMVAEATSLTTHLGTRGVGYINGDLTVGLCRLPVDDWIGVQADSHWAEDGVSVGTATLFDSRGAFGTGMVTGLANPAAQIDFTAEGFQGLRI